MKSSKMTWKMTKTKISSTNLPDKFEKRENDCTFLVVCKISCVQSPKTKECVFLCEECCECVSVCKSLPFSWNKNFSYISSCVFCDNVLCTFCIRISVGISVGFGLSVGLIDGETVGVAELVGTGVAVGENVGKLVGNVGTVGTVATVGEHVGFVGWFVGNEGFVVGLEIGVGSTLVIRVFNRCSLSRNGLRIVLVGNRLIVGSKVGLEDGSVGNVVGNVFCFVGTCDGWIACWVGFEEEVTVRLPGVFWNNSSCFDSSSSKLFGSSITSDKYSRCCKIFSIYVSSSSSLELK